MFRDPFVHRNPRLPRGCPAVMPHRAVDGDRHARALLIVHVGRPGPRA